MAWSGLIDLECRETKADLRRAIEAILTHSPRPGAPGKFTPEQVTMILAVAFPVLVHGLWHWSQRTPVDKLALSPALVHDLRTEVPKGAIVIAPVNMSYRVAAAAPVYIVAAPPTHVADTKANLPYVRYKAVLRWTATGDPAIAKRYGATWAIRSGRLYRLPQ